MEKEERGKWRKRDWMIKMGKDDEVQIKREEKEEGKEEKHRHKEETFKGKEEVEDEGK